MGLPAAYHRYLVIATLCIFMVGEVTAGEIPIEEIVVTARRQPELVNSVPLAILALTRQTITAASIRNLEDIAAHTPGFSYEAQYAAAGGVPTMRGQAPPNAPGDNVAVFVDGVYQAEQNAYDSELLDMERVEVINGPQSSLFGHSSFAGAIRYVSRAPTPDTEWGYQLDAGTDAWGSGQGWWSGALQNSGWLGRIAGSWRRADGTLPEHASPASLGGFERRAFALAFARDVEDATDWTATLRLRHASSDAEHPYQSTINGEDYNCGGVDPTTGYWSYYCGRSPIATSYDLSAGLPDSHSEASQVALELDIPLAGMRLESLTSGYRGEARIVRDFDGSSTGLTFGVCTPGISCPVNGQPGTPVDRLVDVNEVRVQRRRTEEFSQEVRLQGPDHGRVDWLLGAVYFDTRARNSAALGAERGDLTGNELLTRVFPPPSNIARSVTLLNEALVGDPRQQQVEQSRGYEWQKTWAIFAAATIEPVDALRLRAEGRVTWEQQNVESVRENFAPGLGEFPTGRFRDFTPRLSIDYSLPNSTLIYMSAAKGSRSGGINTIPGLLPEEQSYDPEYNWTYELGTRYTGDTAVRSLNVTLYAIRWRDARSLGFSSSPGVDNLITLNTGGIDTRGIEVSTVLQPLQWLRGELAYSRVDGRFRDGSDDPSARAFCGLTGGNTTSTFCTVGPPRGNVPDNLVLVPWLDDNFVSRTPHTMWHAAAVLTPQTKIGAWQLTLRADLSHQSDMYERNLENLQFGERTLLDGRVAVARGPWTVGLWGRNLTDDRYQRSSFSRGALFFPGTTRPIDFLYGAGRRIGITLSHEIG